MASPPPHLMDVQEILQRFDRFDGRFPRAAVEAAVVRREEISPELLHGCAKLACVKGQVAQPRRELRTNAGPVNALRALATPVRSARSHPEGKGSFHLNLKLPNSFCGHLRGVRRQIEDLQLVQGPPGALKHEPTTHKVGHSLTEGEGTALGVTLDQAQDVIIEGQCSTHALMMHNFLSDVELDWTNQMPPIDAPDRKCSYAAGFQGSH